MDRKFVEPVLPIGETIDSDGFHLQTDPPLPLRDHEEPLLKVDPDNNDFVFETHDVTISTSTTLEENENGNPVKICHIVLHGNTLAGETVTVEFPHYKPYFYLSLPENADQKWVDDMMEYLAEISCQRPDLNLNFDEIADRDLVHKLVTVGFRNGDTIPFIRFRFHNVSAYYAFRNLLSELYPPPTREDIEQGNYHNDIMLCEAYAEESMKFYDWYNITSCGWVQLPRKSYWFMNEGRAITHYTFTAETLLPLDIDQISDAVVDSIDVEAVRDAADEEMPNPENPRDVTASIAHTLQSVHRKTAPYYIAWTWGNRGVKIPEFDRKGKPLPKLPIVIKMYKTERDMLVAWSHWWVNRVQSDVVIGWNILGFDLNWIMTKLKIVKGISEYSRVWGRLKNWETKIKGSRIESKAISYKDYKRTPSPGKVFVDLQVLYERDTSIRLHSYKLESVSNHLLKEGKEDVHFTEIKHLFYGNLERRADEREMSPEEQRGMLIYYNVWDTWLVMRLFFHSSIWPKTINVCRVNRVLPELICPRGQQIRVYGGLHYLAQKNNYVVYRPHFHLKLDGPIFDDCDTEKMAGDGHLKEGDIQSLMDYWDEVFERKQLKPVFSTIDIDKDGNESLVQNLDVTGEGDRKTSPQKSAKRGIDDVSNSDQQWETFTKIPESKKFKNNTTSGFQSSLSKLSVRGGPSVEQILKESNRKIKNRDYLGGPRGRLSNNPAPVKSGNKNGKAFSGGRVKEPKRGIYDNMPILDFNSLYPNLMMSYKLDPSLMVLDERYANCPGVKYNRIVFSDKSTFLFAVSKDGIPFSGVMIQHTQNLVSSRKIAQAEEERYNSMIDCSRFQLLKFLSFTPRDQAELQDLYKKLIPVIHERQSEWTLPSQIVESLAVCCATLYLLKGVSASASDTERFIALETKAAKGGLNVESVESLKQLMSLKDMLNVEEFCVRLLQGLAGKEVVVINSFLYTLKEYLIQHCGADKTKVGDLVTKANDAIQTQPQNASFLNTLVTLESYMETQVANYKAKGGELKVGANSCFGFMGAGGAVEYEDPTPQRPFNLCRLKRKGMMSVTPVSACVTYLGRISIERSERYIEDTYNCETVYTDTDSLFIDFGLKGDQGLKKSFIIAKEAAEGITKLFSFPGSTMKIVHEKTARRIVLYDPKCYVLDKYKSDTDVGELEVKGLSLGKRDCCLFVSNLGRKALEIMVRLRDLEGAKFYVQKQAMDLVRFPDKYMDQLAIWKKIGKKDYADKASGHVELAKKIKKRTPSRAPRTGESVKYVYIDVGDLDNKKQMKDKIEEFDWAKEHKLPIDIHWYLTEQLKKTVQKIFAPVMKNPLELLQDAINEQRRRQMKVGGDIVSKLKSMKAYTPL